jgi:hypothetical protein
LDGALQKIVRRHSRFEFAHSNIDPKAISAEPTTNKRRVSVFGGERWIKRLRVKIPFTGDANSLYVAPSGSPTCTYKAEIGPDFLAIIVADDRNAEREVRRFCDHVKGNLDALRRDYERDKPQLEKAVFRAAKHRKAEIAAENEWDRQRSFTVRR